MFFSTIKKCNDDRVIKTGLDAITEFRRAGVGVIAFACCFVKGTLVISFGYDIPYPENMQTAMVMWVIERLPEEEKYKKVEAMTSIGSKDAGGMKDRTHYGVVKILALNITSVPGMVQILLLVCIFTHMLDLYTVAYFFINLAVMVISMRSIFKG